jgi:aminoglycoside phosphotransferase (APT) family kinase protein
MGAPFTVVEHVDGRTVRTRDDVAELTDDAIGRCTAELIRVLVALHALEPGEWGLSGFGRPEGYITRQVALWRRQWDLVRAEESADLIALHAALAERIPPERPAAVVHGDYRIDNVILSADASTIRAVIDWEMSTLGDPLMDLAMMCSYREPVFDLVAGAPAACTDARMASADDLAEQYAKSSHRDLGDWDFYRGLAHFKLAVIAEGIRARHAEGVTVGEGFDRAGQAVPLIVARGLAIVS